MGYIWFNKYIYQVIGVNSFLAFCVCVCVCVCGGGGGGGGHSYDIKHIILSSPDSLFMIFENYLCSSEIY